MAPSEETATATCSQQQKQDVAGAKLQQDSPKIQQDAPANLEEDMNSNTSPCCTGQVIDGLRNASDHGDNVNRSTSPSCVDSVTDGVKSVTTDCAENADSVAESRNSTSACVKPHVNGPKSGFNSCVENTDSVVDRHKIVDTTCKEDIDHVLGSSHSVANTDQVVDDPDNSVTTTGNVCRAGHSPLSVVVAGKINDDQILDGPKEAAAGSVENPGQVVTSAKNVSATCVDSVINKGVVNPSVDRVVSATEDSVVDNPEYITCASTENTADVTGRPENKAGLTNAISRVENIACVASVTKQQVTNMITDDASHASVASKVVDMETANEGKDADVFCILLASFIQDKRSYACVCVCVCACARGHTRVFGGVITDSSVWPRLCSFISAFPYSLSLYASSLNCRTTSWITEKLGFDSRR